METLGRTHTASGIAAEVYRALGFRVCRFGGILRHIDIVGVLSHAMLMSGASGEATVCS